MIEGAGSYVFPATGVVARFAIGAQRSGVGVCVTRRAVVGSNAGESTQWILTCGVSGNLRHVFVALVTGDRAVFSSQREFGGIVIESIRGAPGGLRMARLAIRPQRIVVWIGVTGGAAGHIQMSKCCIDGIRSAVWSANVVLRRGVVAFLTGNR